MEKIELPLDAPDTHQQSSVKRRFGRRALCVCATVLFSAQAFAEEDEPDPAALDPEFHAGSGAEDGNVYSLQYQHDSDPDAARVLVGGSFLGFGGASHRYLTILDGTGTVVPEEEFDPATIEAPLFPPGRVDVARWDSEGRVLIAGLFNSVGGEDRGSIARLNADGSLDSSFDPPAVSGGRVWDLVVLDDDSVVIVGEFNQLGGDTANRIARLNADGSRDTGFGSSGGFNGNVYTLTQAANGDLLVGGNFTGYGSASVSRLVRLDGATGDRIGEFDIGDGFSGGAVRTVYAAGDGSLLVGGGFTSFDGEAVNRLVRLNAEGERQPLNIGAGFNDTVRGLAVDAEGRILAAGEFNQAGNQSRVRIARLLEDGSVDPVFDPEGGATGGDADIYALVYQPDGKILIGGGFRSYRGQPHRRVARLQGGGEVVEPGEGYESWRQDKFGADAGNDAISGPLADPDGDGVPNLLEYAFEGEPFEPYSATLPVPSIETDGGERFLEITFLRINDPDLVYRVRASDDLGDWSEEVWSSTDHPFGGSGNSESVTVRDTEAIGSGTSRFLRVDVMFAD